MITSLESTLLKLTKHESDAQAETQTEHCLHYLLELVRHEVHRGRELVHVVPELEYCNYTKRAKHNY